MPRAGIKIVSNHTVSLSNDIEVEQKEGAFTLTVKLSKGRALQFVKIALNGFLFMYE